MSVHHWVNDDDGYEAWVQRHPAGYVVNLSKRTSARSHHLKIHQASHRLPDRSNPASVNPWTGNGYTKATSESLKALLDWIVAKGFVIEKKHYCKPCRLLDKAPGSNVPQSLSPAVKHHLHETSDSAVPEIEGSAVPNLTTDFDPQNLEDARCWINASIVRRQGQGKFRADVLAAYENRCAISACDVLEALEAAHIFGYMGTETNVVTNGLLLRSDLHTLYDRGLIAINPTSMKVLLAPKLKGTDYGYLAGATIRLPSKTGERPSLTALKMHSEWAKSRWK